VSQAWEYDGVDLTRIGYNVRLLGAPLNTPARRGENLLIPGRAGRQYVSKQLEQRLQTLAMWAINEPAGGGTGSEANMLANLDTLRGLFARAGQHTLKQTYGSAERVATVEVANAVEFEPRVFNAAYAFVVEFLMADPLWYATAATTVGPTVISSSPQNIAVTNGGTYQAEKATITITGPITDPKLTVGVWVLYTGTVAAGETLTINCATWTATLAGADVSANISHDGDLRWLVFPVGANTLVVTGSGYTGATTVTITFTAAYI